MANQKLQIDILANDKSKQAFNKVQGSIARVKSSIFNLKNAFIGLGAGVVLKGIINAGRTEYFGKNFTFNYNDFKLYLIECDSMRIRVENLEDPYARPQRLFSTIEGVRGEIQIDDGNVFITYINQTFDPLELPRLTSSFNIIFVVPDRSPFHLRFSSTSIDRH